MDYIPQWQMSAVWQRITGDSFIVSIEALRVKDEPEKVVNYLTKYLIKACHWNKINLGLLQGFHLAGSWRLAAEERHYLECPRCGLFPIWIRMSSDDFYASGGRGIIDDRIDTWRRVSIWNTVEKMIPPRFT
jgi:hypothetical protein